MLIRALQFYVHDDRAAATSTDGRSRSSFAANRRWQSERVALLDLRVLIGTPRRLAIDGTAVVAEPVPIRACALRSACRSI